MTVNAGATVGRWRHQAQVRWRRLHGDPVRGESDRGYSTLEAVILVPTIIILTLLVVQFALLWHGRHVAEAAAQAAARSAAGYSATAAAGQADGASYLAQVAPNLLQNPTVTVVRNATTVQATVNATVVSVIPFGTFGITEAAVTPVEVFVAGVRG